ncbi:MAG: hypothetical protein KF901_12665 [Myxococcales bacterium]|nr:hypothetical protein [Myxococcales bacterium]
MLRLGMSCFALALALGCADNGPGPAGSACLTSAECVEGTLCFPIPRAGNYCMTVCEDERLCSDGSVCLATESDVSLCYLGGSVALGAGCASSADCEQGLVCVAEEPGAAAFCRRACDRRAAVVCSAGEACLPAGEEPKGYCGAPPSGD